MSRASKRKGKDKVKAPVDLLGEDHRRPRQIITPEGIPLDVRIADAGERAVAFVLDAGIILLCLLALGLLWGLAFGGEAELDDGGFLTAFVLLAAFLLRNFYFLFFELRWQGATPGKRLLTLRVIDRRGGPLTAAAVVARNLVRDVEVFVPLSVVFAHQSLWPGAPGWVRLLAGLWVVVLLFMPLFNRDRLRVGDLVAGTLVIAAPRAVLLPELSAARAPTEARPSTPGRARPAPAYTFTKEQLDTYGIYELQVLERVLRGDGNGDGDREQALTTIADRIRQKLRWKGPRVRDERRFLQDFYDALRARLETQLLFGERRQDKHRNPPGAPRE